MAPSSIMKKLAIYQEIYGYLDDLLSFVHANPEDSDLHLLRKRMYPITRIGLGLNRDGEYAWCEKLLGTLLRDHCVFSQAIREKSGEVSELVLAMATEARKELVFMQPFDGDEHHRSQLLVAFDRLKLVAFDKLKLVAEMSRHV